MGVEDKKKLIKLYCPSMAKLAQMVAWEEQKLDLGYISRAFGLDPTTVKINGHFIARGVDFVASSVTWKSLFSFFSARGLSTGSSDSDALTVDGKLSKLGSKRPHDPSGPGNGVLITGQAGGTSYSSKELHLDNPDFVGQKRLKDSNAGKDQINAFNSYRMKRKSVFGDAIPLKRERRNSTTTGLEERKYDDLQKTTILNNKYGCRTQKGNMKRLGEEDFVTAPQKRIRL